METSKRILVIGAGASGLAAIKSCKEELLDVVCYEKTKDYGGWWRYSHNSVQREASVMKSTVCISSKEMGAFSDFPPPSDFPNYMQHTKMMAYLTLYAQKFDLLRHIKYQREVIRVIPSSEYEQNGKWLVIFSNGFNKSQETEEFDGVMVCTGHLSKPFIPTYPDQDLFKGITLHSQLIKSASAFEDIRVLVAGNGNSAVDAAVEISTVAQQVYLSTRKGFWVFPKMGPKGLPYDLTLLRRDIHFLKKMCSEVANRYVEKYLETKINHSDCRIKPLYRALDKHPTVNDDLPDKILTGRIIIKGPILSFAKDGVFFDHEEDITEIDAVIFATGYTMTVPFLETKIYRDVNGLPNLYKRVFPMCLKHPTLSLIGFVESFGPQIPISESQCRWVARLLAQKIQLPPKTAMKTYMTSKASKMNENSSELMEDYIEYMDELAEEYGAKPNICSLLFKDSTLFWACFTGPFLPYQYRLFGPNSLKNARDLILQSEERVKEPFDRKQFPIKF